MSVSGVGGKVFESDEFLVRVCGDHMIYAEKAEVRFEFRNIRKIRIVRDRAKGTVSETICRVKGQLVARINRRKQTFSGVGGTEPRLDFRSAFG